MIDLHVHIIDPDEQSFGEQLTFDLAAPLTVTGLQGLVNRWMMLFFTPKGSDPVEPTRGTEFPYLIGSNTDDKQSLQALLSEYVEDANVQIKQSDRTASGYERADRLHNAEIIQFTRIDAQRAEFWVEVTNQLYERANALIPYKVSR